MDKIRDSLYIGDVHDAKRRGREMDVVVSLNGFDLEHTDFSFSLKDGRNNNFSNFTEAVQKVSELYDEEGEVLVHCTVGASRSPAVISAVLSLKEDENFEDILYEINKKHPVTNIHPKLKEHALRYIKEVSV